MSVAPAAEVARNNEPVSAPGAPPGGTPAAAKSAGSNDPPVSWTAMSSTLLFVVSVVSTFFLSPYLIGTLGDARYGTWTLVAQMTGYYALLDFGTRGAVGYFVASLGAKGRSDELSSVVSTAFFTLLGIGVVVAAIGGVLAFYLPALFSIPPEFEREARNAMLVLVMTIAITLPFDVWNATVNGCRRGYIVTLTETVMRVVTSIAIAIVLYMGGGLVALALTQLVGKTVVWAVTFRATRRLIPDLRVRASSWSKASLRRIAGYGGGNFVINICLMVINRMDLLVVGAVLGVRHVTFYTIGQMLVAYASGAVSNITRAFTMHFAHLHSSGDHERLRRLYLDGVRHSATVAIPLTVYLLAFGSAFISLWLGPEYVTGDWKMRSDVILGILILGKLPRFVQSISWQLLFGAHKVAFLTKLQVAEASANAALSLSLVHVLGMPGVALGTFFPVLISNFFFLPPYILREFGFTFREYISEGLGRPLALGVAVSAISFGLTQAVPPTSWQVFMSEAAVAGGVGLLLIGRFVLTSSERTLVMTLISRRLGRARA
ncbi:MAG TPA: oligosaccharide flippase family protein [Gemmatimonadales bacterium]|nr:oligosaccharide flippase family protein [Gemmatimonadales bacterium]